MSITDVILLGVCFWVGDLVWCGLRILIADDVVGIWGLFDHNIVVCSCTGQMETKQSVF